MLARKRLRTGFDDRPQNLLHSLEVLALAHEFLEVSLCDPLRNAATVTLAVLEPQQLGHRFERKAEGQCPPDQPDALHAAG